MRYLVNEIDENKKTNSIINTYLEIVKKNKNKSKKVLLLTPNNKARLSYQRKINLDYSEERNINTFIGFIKKELVKYWPIIIEKCDIIKNNSVTPVFIQSSLSEYIITKEVEKKRNTEGYFDDLIGTSKNIAKSILNNINKAAFNLIDFDIIGEKIYLSKKNRDKLLRFSYTQMDEIINNYINTLLENAMIDNALSVYLYSKYLLKDKLYLDNLRNEIEYLIVDSLESCSVSECEFINIVSEYAIDSYLYFNKRKDYSVFNNVDTKFLQENIVNNFENQIEEYSEFDEIKIEDLYLLHNNIHLNESSQTFSEMIEVVCDKVVELVSRGVHPKEISIISPVNNSVLNYSLKNRLEKNNINIFSTKKDRKIIDYPYANALVVASCLFYDYDEYIKDEDYISFLEILLDTNKIQATKIFRDREKLINQDSSVNLNENIEELDLFSTSINEFSEKLSCSKKSNINMGKDDLLISEYQNMISYINDKKDNNLKINEFIMQFYIDKMLNLKDGKTNVNICKKIIHESEVFTENISLLGLDKKIEKEKIFIEALRTTINDFYGVNEIEELVEEDKVVITTPFTYISTNMERKIHIWVDIGSNAWNMKIEKDISNMIVLRKSFEEKRVYTDDIEEYYKKYYLYNTVYNLLKNSKEIYAYKSDYTINGYMQESMLYGLLLKLIS